MRIPAQNGSAVAKAAPWFPDKFRILNKSYVRRGAGGADDAYCLRGRRPW